MKRLLMSAAAALAMTGALFTPGASAADENFNPSATANVLLDECEIFLQQRQYDD